MKHQHLIPCIAFPAIFAVSAMAQDPVLATPGTATLSTQTTATGSTTVFTLTGDTVFDWAHLNLAQGSELVFNFLAGESVINVLGGNGVHRINGNVTSNGIVAFFAPGGDLEVNGRITARGVVLGTTNVDPADFFDGNGYSLSNASGLNFLTVNGDVTALGGDVVLAGPQVVVGQSAKIRATGRAGIAGSSEIAVSAGSGGLLRENGGSGFVLNLGEARAARIDVVAGNEVNNQGVLNAGNGRVFLEVGSGGVITNETNGIIIGNLAFQGLFREKGAILTPNEGDALPVVSEGTLTMPALRRPDGTQVSASQTVRTNSAVSASGDGGRDSRNVGRPSTAESSRRSLMQRTSFFGMRGGDAKAEKR
ncbi:MAG: hypothetical protein ABJQ29_12990 [Luteolibacter sp.]